MNNAMEFLLEQTKEREDQAVLALNKARSDLEDYYRQVEQIKKISSRLLPAVGRSWPSGFNRQPIRASQPILMSA